MLLAGLALLLTGAGLAVLLIAAYERGAGGLEVVRTAATVVVGAGGLGLMARRQRSAEIALLQKEVDQAHAERVAAATEADAAERRLAELFTDAAAQLASNRPPVRLVGAHALARLGRNWEGQRQVVVDVLCAWLRMTDEDARGRRAVQKVRCGVMAHVAGSAFFSGAVFRESVAFCRPAALCRGSDFPTTFAGYADFAGARFEGDAHVGKVGFLGNCGWAVHHWAGRDGRRRGAVSSGAQFTNAVFAGTADVTQRASPGRSVPALIRTRSRPVCRSGPRSGPRGWRSRSPAGCGSRC